MLPLVLTMPFYVLLITMIVECSLMLTQKIGSVGAAYSASRAAAVWLPYENAMPKNAPDYTPLEQRQAMVRLAAARAMWPYASGAESHASSGQLDESLNATIDQQIAAFQAYSGDQKFDMEYLKRKFAYAYNGSTIETVYLDPVSLEPYDDKETPAFNATIELTLRYEAPIHTYGIGRLFGEKSQFGNYFIRPVVTTVLIENEGVKDLSIANAQTSVPKAGKSLGIRYYAHIGAVSKTEVPTQIKINIVLRKLRSELEDLKKVRAYIRNRKDATLRNILQIKPGGGLASSNPMFSGNDLDIVFQGGQLPSALSEFNSLSDQLQIVETQLTELEKKIERLMLEVGQQNIVDK